MRFKIAFLLPDIPATILLMSVGTTVRLLFLPSDSHLSFKIMYLCFVTTAFTSR